MNQEIFDKIKSSNSKFIHLCAVDAEGWIKSKVVSKEHFVKNNSLLFQFPREAISRDYFLPEEDLYLKMDPKTLRHCPWDLDNLLLLGDLFVKKEDHFIPSDLCSRQILRKMISQVDEYNLSVECGFELEWYNVKRERGELLEIFLLREGQYAYSPVTFMKNHDYWTSLLTAAEGSQLAINAAHAELGVGANEISIEPSDPLEAADRAVLMRTLIEKMALDFKLISLFMAKFSNDLPGAGLHFHQSLKLNHQHILHENELLFKNYLSGQVLHANEFCLYYAPHVNSYKRYNCNLLSPKEINAGVNDRTSAFRILVTENLSRIENRLAGIDANPYLVAAASLATGHLGIKDGSTMRANHLVSTHRSLSDALKSFNQSGLASNYFGQEIVQNFKLRKTQEWNDYLKSVTGWEILNSLKNH